MHAFNHAPAALRIFRFAADTAPRVLEITHVTKFLRECAVEFGSADATLPGALRNDEYADKRDYKLRDVVERNAACCPWLAEKLFRAFRSGAPMPAAALAPDVTRHDVDWGAEGARRSAALRPTHGGYGLTRDEDTGGWWAQGAVGVTSGSHFFQVCVTEAGGGDMALAWVDDKISIEADDWVGRAGTQASGIELHLNGSYYFGTAPLVDETESVKAPRCNRPCVIGCLLNLDATPARMTVFVDGEPLAEQCECDFPKDGRAWFPSVALCALHSCAM
jgi:hypothetical protein